MPLKHLTDDQLQDYLDNNSEKADPEILMHLEICDQCHTRLENYRLLYGELKKLPEPNLSPDFAATVAALLPTEMKKSFAGKLSSYLLPILGGAATLVLTSYFVDLKTLGNRLAEIFTPLTKLPAVLNGNLNLLIYTGLILILLVLIDSFIIQPRQKTF